MHFVFMMLLLFRGSFYRLVSSDLDTLTVGRRCPKAMAADVDHFNSSSVSTCEACWCRMGGMGLVEWVLGCNEPAALTHNVTPERGRASTECMHFLPIPPGGALLMHPLTSGMSYAVCVPFCSISVCLSCCWCLHILYSETMRCTFYLPFVF